MKSDHHSEAIPLILIGFFLVFCLLDALSRHESGARTPVQASSVPSTGAGGRP